MKAVTLDAFGTPPATRDDLPAPTPGANEVLVRVHASSANPVDNAIAAGMLKDIAEHEFPVILGRDYAGVVERPRRRRHRLSPSAMPSTASSCTPTRASTTERGPS